jgi:hypothetical protein
MIGFSRRNRDSSVGITRGTGCTTGVRFPAGVRDFYLFRIVKTAYAVHHIQWIRGILTSSSAEVKMAEPQLHFPICLLDLVLH